MKRILVSIATVLLTTLALVACNSDSTNASDVSSGGAVSLAKAVCTSSANWQSVGIGMTASQVQARLGAPIRIVAVPPNTEYHYEKCRGFFIIPKDDPPFTLDVGGIVVISGNRGVLSVSSPERPAEKIACEWDYYNFPYKTFDVVNGQIVNDNCRPDKIQF